MCESDSEIDMSGGLFDFDMSDSHPKAKVGDLTFWEKLHTQEGQNTLGNIILSTGLTEELKPPGQNNGGLMYICAVPLAGSTKGYQLIGTHTETHEGSVPVYWMPWKSGETVYAERKWFERSKCAYFLTAQLTGCRFVVTHDYVLHIASNVNFAPAGPLGSSVRDVAELTVTGGQRGRRFSFNGGELGYSKNALAFGMRKDDIWTYKALKYSLGDEGGDWVILIT